MQTAGRDRRLPVGTDQVAAGRAPDRETDRRLLGLVAAVVDLEQPTAAVAFDQESGRPQLEQQRLAGDDRGGCLAEVVAAGSTNLDAPAGQVVGHFDRQASDALCVGDQRGTPERGVAEGSPVLESRQCLAQFFRVHQQGVGDVGESDVEFHLWQNDLTQAALVAAALSRLARGRPLARWSEALGILLQPGLALLLPSASIGRRILVVKAFSGSFEGIDDFPAAPISQSRTLLLLQHAQWVEFGGPEGEDTAGSDHSGVSPAIVEEAFDRAGRICA